MAITGRFVADFDSFYAAVQKADVSLKGMETRAGTVSTSLTKMANSLSGNKLIQDATLMAEAVARAGGAATLTAAEQAKVNRVVAEAIEKYAALGQQAPKVLTDLATATTAAVKPFTLLESHLQGVQQHLSSFSGDKVIQEATQMARAIEQIGGASKLTAAEQAKVNSVVSEAVAKYAALGQSAPAALRELATATKSVSGPMSSLDDHLKKIQQQVSAFSGDKIIQEATQMARAVEQLGGASKLTAAEKAKLNATLTEAIAKYKALGQEAPKAMTDLAAATVKVQAPTSFLSKTFGDLGTQLKATALGFISAQAIIGAVTTGFRLLTDFVGSSVASFAAAEAASRKLEAALKAQGDATPGLAKQYDALANKFQTTTVFADDLITEMQALLVQVGDVGPQQMEKALTAATDLASGLGIDLRTATLLVGKAFEGETGTLKKYGIVIDEAKLKTQGITAVMDAVQEKFGGQAQAEIDTYAGKIKQLANAWDDVKESVGGFIVQQPALEVALSQALDLLRGQTSATGELTEATDRQAKSWFGADLGVFGFANGLRDGLRIVNDMAIGVDALRLELEMLSKVKPPATFGVGAPILLEGIDKMIRLRQEAENLVQQGLKPLNKEQTELIRLFDKGGKSAGEIATKLEISERAVKKYLDAVKDGAKAHEQMEAAMDKAAVAGVKAFKDWHATIDKLNFDMGLLVRGRLNEIGEAAKKELSKATAATERWIEAFESGLPVVKGLGDALKDIGEKVPVSITPLVSKFTDLRDAADAFAGALGHLGRVVGGVFGSILQGASGALTSFADLADATDTYRTALYNAQQAGKSTFALTAQYAIQAAASVVSYVQTAIGIIEALYDDLSGKELTAALNARGGRNEFVTQLRLAGVGFQGFSDDASTFRSELVRFDAAIAASTARMERYGLTWLDLRDDLRQVQIDHFTRTLITDFRALERQLGSTQGAIRAMGPALSNYVQQAIASGTKIPVAMKPILEQLIRMGGLTDAAARAMLGLEADTMPALADIKEAAERYGLTLDQLGPKVQQLRINETASQIVKDFDLLSLAGANVGDVMLAMKDQVQALVTNALKLGLSLPESMRPLLDAMIRAGLLTDQFGNKLTNVEQLTFAETLTGKIDQLIDRLGDLIDAMSKVGTAAEREFGRARGAAEALGRAIPRGSVPTGAETAEPSGTATPRPGSTAALAEDAAASAAALPPSVTDVARGRVLQFPQPLPVLAPTLASEVSPSVAAGIAAGAAPTTIILEMDSRQVAEATVPHIPGVVQRYGLA